MVSNSPVGIYAKIGEIQNGTQEYQRLVIDKEGRPGAISVKVAEKNVDTFDKLNIDSVVAAGDLNKKMKLWSFGGLIVGALAPYLAIATTGKNRMARAIISLLSGIAGAAAGFFGGGLLGSKIAVPKTEQRIAENEKQMQELIIK